MCIHAAVKIQILWVTFKYINVIARCEYTVNRERFAGPNFHGFRGFEEDRKSFSVNILHERLFDIT